MVTIQWSYNGHNANDGLDTMFIMQSLQHGAHDAKVTHKGTCILDRVCTKFAQRKSYNGVAQGNLLIGIRMMDSAQWTNRIQMMKLP